MTDTIIAVVLMALLFVLFGAVKYRGCTGQCGGCTGACGRHNEGEHDVH
jgi:heterodisulfide reductase subunit C